MMKPKTCELVVAAGEWASLSAALDAGADAVYFGVKDFNLRINAGNFEISEFRKIAEHAHRRNAKAYLALNAICFNNDMKVITSILRQAKDRGVDAVICWDFAVIKTAKEIGLPVHISTQASVSNSTAAAYYYDQGIRRIVLARECTLEQIRAMSEDNKQNNRDLALEVFIHGALCLSLSGRCFISEYLFGHSANRGDCLQPCRRSFTITDKQEGGELDVGDGYILSAKDLCSVEFIDTLIESGIYAFKIEGRTRPADYIKVTTEVYRRAIDDYFKETLTNEKKAAYKQQLEQVYNRGFSNGFYFGVPINDLSTVSGSAAEKRKLFVGEVRNFFKKLGVAEIQVLNEVVNLGDTVLFTGKKTGARTHIIEEIQIDHVPIETAKKGTCIAIKTDFLVRKNDKMFVLR